MVFLLLLHVFLLLLLLLLQLLLLPCWCSCSKAGMCLGGFSGVASSRAEGIVMHFFWWGGGGYLDPEGQSSLP